MSKLGLLFGCNYAGTPSALKGCINDIVKVESFLSSRGYTCCSYIDSSKDENLRPTRQKILDALRHYVTSLKKGDILFVSYSGHGSSIKDRDRDEDDGRDECICPCDYDINGMITDDELRAIFTQGCKGSKIFVLLDCCHSGTVLDLRYNYVFIGGKRYTCKEDKYDRTEASIWALAGCTDATTSADITFKGRRGGALTIAFLECIGKATTFNELTLEIRAFISQNHLSEQIPQLSSGRSPSDKELFI